MCFLKTSDQTVTMQVAQNSEILTHGLTLPLILFVQSRKWIELLFANHNENFRQKSTAGSRPPISQLPIG